MGIVLCDCRCGVAACEGDANAWWSAIMMSGRTGYGSEGCVVWPHVQVRRFVRFNLGEGLQKKSVDFAAEVAAQTAAKVEEKAPAEAPKVEEAKKEEEGPKVRVSMGECCDVCRLFLDDWQRRQVHVLCLLCTP